MITGLFTLFGIIIGALLTWTKGVEAEETKEKRKELEDTFNEIMQGFQTKIQKNIDDLYYKYLN